MSWISFNGTINSNYSHSVKYLPKRRIEMKQMKNLIMYCSRKAICICPFVPVQSRYQRFWPQEEITQREKQKYRHKRGSAITACPGLGQAQGASCQWKSIQGHEEPVCCGHRPLGHKPSMDGTQVCLPTTPDSQARQVNCLSSRMVKKQLHFWKIVVKFCWQRDVPKMSVAMSVNCILENTFQL